MSETDRIARIESALTGRNAWNTGRQWADRHHTLIHERPNGTSRILSVYEERDTLLAFSRTLDGRHHSLLKHIRDKDPLHSNDPISDAMIGLMLYTSPDLLARMPDDPQGFRGLWTFSGQEADWPVSSDNNLLGETDARECRTVALKTITRYRSWQRKFDWQLNRLTDGAYGCLIISEDATGARIGLKRYAWNRGSRWLDDPMMELSDDLEIRLEPDSFDWRHDGSDVHGVIRTRFACRPNNGRQWNAPPWHRTPECLAGAIIRQLKGKGLL